MPMLAAAALLLPAIIALAVWFTSQQDQQRQAIERNALETARQIGALADSEVTANYRLITLLADARTLAVGDFDMFRERIRSAFQNNPDWNALVLREAEGGAILFEIARPGAPQPSGRLRPLPARVPRKAAAETVTREGRYCPCVVLHVAAGRSRVLTLFLSPNAFQRLLMAHVPKDGVSALATRDALFIARSIAFSERVGGPTSRYLAAAARKGGEGIYSGVTLEGFESYTAYTTSPQTGWSAHVAVARSAIDSPRGWANIAVGTAILAALALAAGLSFYAAYEARRRRIDEQRLVGMQKAEAISHFTGMMAHDFRNILAVIDAGSRLILRRTAEPDTTKLAHAIGDAVERGNRLVNQLLSFVRGDGAEVGPVDLKALLENADELIGRSMGEAVTFTWSVDDDARWARANPDQLELALLNLAINASDAMAREGKFSLSATREDGMVAITACDSGPGVPQALRERIFEAFYSTKANGPKQGIGGTGLGLAQVAGAARHAGGDVTIKDAPNGGACFVIRLPAAEPPAQ